MLRLEMTVTALTVGCALLAGCATTMSSPDAVATEVRKPSDLAACDAAGQAGEQLDSRIVVGLLDEKRFHAALARLDAMPQSNAYTRYLRAHVLRQLDREEEAAGIYEALLDTCMQGYARHGLGLLAARRGDIGSARSYLRQAREQIPLDVRVRNDYGYVLLLSGQVEAAYGEFMTALELNGDVRQPRHNALLALMLLGRMQQAEQFAERTELSDADVARAREKARKLAGKHTQMRQGEVHPDHADGQKEALLLKMDTRANIMRGDE